MQSELWEQPSTSCNVATLEVVQKAAEAMPWTTSLPSEGFILSITLNEHKVFETTERVGLESHTKESRAFSETTAVVAVYSSPTPFSNILSKLACFLFCELLQPFFSRSPQKRASTLSKCGISSGWSIDVIVAFPLVFIQPLLTLVQPKKRDAYHLLRCAFSIGLQAKEGLAKAEPFLRGSIATLIKTSLLCSSGWLGASRLNAK